MEKISKWIKKQSACGKDLNNQDSVHLIQGGQEAEEENNKLNALKDTPSTESHNCQLFLPVDGIDAFDYEKIENTKFT